MLTQTAEVTLTFLLHIVLLYGIPQFIVTDQGSQFMSDFLKDYVNYSNRTSLTLQLITHKAMELWKEHTRQW
jgi:hypothetical protein